MAEITNMTYGALNELLCQANRRGQVMEGYVVFDACNFLGGSTIGSRTYRVSSDNGAFKSGSRDQRVFADRLDGLEQHVRFDIFRKGKKIERCYVETY